MAADNQCGMLMFNDTQYLGSTKLFWRDDKPP
jgi:hypothetical protein